MSKLSLDELDYINLQLNIKMTNTQFAWRDADENFSYFCSYLKYSISITSSLILCYYILKKGYYKLRLMSLDRQLCAIMQLQKMERKKTSIPKMIKL